MSTPEIFIAAGSLDQGECVSAWAPLAEPPGTGNPTGRWGERVVEAEAMRRFLFLPLLLSIVAGPATAQQGPLRTLMVGSYVCERPAAYGGQVVEPEPAASFAVINASSYVASDGKTGTYLMTGGTVTMTSGPLAGTRLVRVRPAFLRRIEANGVPGPLRCVLSRSSDTQ
jgi:hypothetical protein